MATVDVTEKNFAEITRNGIVLLDWWAAWCGPCRTFGPIYDAASDRHADVVFGKIDTDAEQGLAGAFGIRSIPTLMVFRDGVLVFAQPGLLPANVIDQLVTEVKKLDMDEVRRKVAEAEKEEAANGEGESGPP